MDIKRFSGEDSRRNRAYLALCGTVGALGLTFLYAGLDDAPKVAPQNVTCEPSGQQAFTFREGQGVRIATQAIEGSGTWDGNPCWDEAVAAVKAELGETYPQPGQTINIPARLTPIEN